MLQTMPTRATAARNRSLRAASEHASTVARQSHLEAAEQRPEQAGELHRDERGHTLSNAVRDRELGLIGSRNGGLEGRALLG
jgi:hypothetical protein